MIINIKLEMENINKKLEMEKDSDFVFMHIMTLISYSGK